MCAMQGISLVVKIKTTPGKSVFCCFRTSEGGKSLPIRSRQRLCVCCLCVFTGFGPGTRQEGCCGSGVLGWGSGAPSMHPCGSRRPSPPQLPANSGASPLGASGGSRCCPAAKGPSVSNTAERQPRASGSEAFGGDFGQERGGVYPVRSCGGNPRRPCPGSRAGAVRAVTDGRTARCHRPGRGRGRRNRTGTAREPGAAPRGERAGARPRRLAGGDSTIGRT